MRDATILFKRNFFNENEDEKAELMGPVATQMEAKLQAAFDPRKLELIDESNQHHGHSGAHPSGESHFRLRISAAALDGKSRVAQHRLIHEALAQELKNRVHALAIEVV